MKFFVWVVLFSKKSFAPLVEAILAKGYSVNPFDADTPISLERQLSLPVLVARVETPEGTTTATLAEEISNILVEKRLRFAFKYITDGFGSMSYNIGVVPPEIQDILSADIPGAPLTRADRILREDPTE